MKYYLIKDDKLWDKINHGFNNDGGVYKVHCLKNNNESKVHSLTRLLGEDTEGVLYIGKADSFLDRVIDLKKSLLPNYKSENHHVGLRYNKNQALQSKFKIENLCVSLIKSSNPSNLEKDELKKYEKIFGELPPFNAMS